ncbi:MAG: SBBP repeat-containing protein [Bryobacteraceae bacterium]|nr:SBBP repeat-containing protein [Bryobacteraceae bacterium]
MYPLFRQRSLNVFRVNDALPFGRRPPAAPPAPGRERRRGRLPALAAVAVSMAWGAPAGISDGQPAAVEVPPFFVASRAPDSGRPVFLLQTRRFGANFDHGGAVFHVNGQTLAVRFAGASAEAAIEGVDRLEGYANFLFGDDPSQWRTGLPLFTGLVYRELYPGIDLSYSTARRGLKGEFVARPGSDPAAIRLRYPDASSLWIAEDGSLVVETAAGRLRESPPVAYQLKDGARAPVAARYRVLEPAEVGFEIGDYEPALALIVDPELQFSTLLGGSSIDYVTDLAVSPAGEIHLAGWTDSANFPVVNSIQNRGGSVDAFVVKYNAAATDVAWATFVGGSGDDRANGVALDSVGNVFLAGYTTSTNFPKQAPRQSTLAGGRDAFLLKLNAAGTMLAFSTYFGGSGQDDARSVAVDSSGNAYIAGGTYSPNFPILNAFQNLNAGGQDAFAAKFSGTGTLHFSTLLGGQSDDRANGVAVDSSGNAYLTGSTESVNLPATGAFQPSLAGRQDAFVAKLSAGGSQLHYCTYLGGSGGGGGSPEEGVDIAVDVEGRAYVTGSTSSTDFPTASPAQAVHGGGVMDAFVTKLSAAGNSLVYSTYLGGRSADYGFAVTVDPLRQAYVVGQTASTNFPTLDPLQAANAGLQDGFITKLTSGGNELLFSSYLGGNAADAAAGVGLDAAGLLYVAGVTQSSNFPKVNAIQPWHGGGVDLFAIRMQDYVPAPPQAVSVSPSSGAGVSQTFRLVYSDTNRYQELGWVFVLFQAGLEQANSCYAQYRQSERAVYLRSNEGSSWLGPAEIGTAGTLENSQCAINLQGTTASGSGTTLTLDLAVSFKEPFAGSKTIYMYASDTSGLNTGWVSRGSWSVSGFAPKAVSVTPSSGSANSQTFTFVYSDADGYAQLGWGYALFQTSILQSNACYVRYERATNTLWLRNDAGNTWAGPIAPGVAGALSNSQCSLNGAGSSASGSGTTLTVNLALTFGGAFIGAKNIYMLAGDLTGLDSGWQTRGAWSIPGNPPQAASMNPSSGTGVTQTFQFVFTDADGFGQIAWSYALLQANLVQSSACYIQYKQTDNTLWLRDDAGTAWLPPIAAGASGTLQNSQCILNAQTSSVSGSGVTLTLNLSITFKPAFLGSKKAYMYAIDATNLNSGWQQRGTWTVGGWAPEAVSVTPSSGSGNTRSFRLAYNDNDGFTQLGWNLVLFQTQIVGANSCYVQYKRSDNSLWLRNDADNGWLGPVTAGASGTLENNQCRINAATSAASGSGSTLTVDVDLTFKAAFAGVKNVYMLTSDTTGLSSGWQTRGTWTVP